MNLLVLPVKTVSENSLYVAPSFQNNEPEISALWSSFSSNFIKTFQKISNQFETNNNNSRMLNIGITTDKNSFAKFQVVLCQLRKLEPLIASNYKTVFPATLTKCSASFLAIFWLTRAANNHQTVQLIQPTVSKF